MSDVATLAARRALERCDALARFSEMPDRLTRTFLSPPMHDVHAALRAWMEDAGLAVRVDAVGNLIGRYPALGEPAAAPTLVIGSHLDTVPDAGKYDGILGVLLGLAVIEALAGRRLSFAVEIVGFSEEEGVRFHTPYLGSKAVCAEFADSLLTLRDDAGVSVAEAICAFGKDPADIAEAAYNPALLVGYLEAHIEQGPVLESRGLPVGIVTAIAGQTRARLRFIGNASHAGTTPMAMRRDALVAAAEFIVAVETLGRETADLVATVGSVTVEPNAGNVIPGAVEISLDVRHAVDATRESAVAALVERADDIARQRALRCEVARRQDFAAVPMDGGFHALLRDAVAGESGSAAPAAELMSGAGHDAAVMASITRAAMLFLRSPKGGISHHPDETVLPNDVEVAVRVMLRFITLLDANRRDEKEGSY